MKITNIEVVQGKKPIPLGGQLRLCYEEPDVRPFDTTTFTFYRVQTDEGITGIAPATHQNIDPMVKELLVGSDPCYIERFFQRAMTTRNTWLGKTPVSGLEIAMWDIMGKAARMPVFKLLGACRDRIPAYCSTVQLHSAEETIIIAERAYELGFKAIKIRFHRENPRDDLDVAQALVERVQGRMEVMVDANQSNPGLSYRFWSYKTALAVARELEAMGVAWLEEPLPRSAEDDLARLCDAVEIDIAGGEHHETVEPMRNALMRGVYDVIQPDTNLGNIGITGLRKLGILAGAHGRKMSPHVLFGGNQALYLAAALHALGSLSGETWLEYVFDPPVVSPENQQQIVKKQILVGEDGCVAIPTGPGLGVELNEDFVRSHV